MILRNYWAAALLATLGVATAAGAGVVYVGVYEIGADTPHWPVTVSLIETVRQYSLKARTDTLVVPDLDNAAAIADGAGEYEEMCVNCHLAPGRTDSQLRAGLYPQPPDLTRMHIEPAQAFWVIKHGIKMSAMPAWGKSHDDATIWNMVAFLRQLPELTPASYRKLVATAQAAGMAHHEAADAEVEEHHHNHRHKHSH